MKTESHFADEKQWRRAAALLRQALSGAADPSGSPPRVLLAVSGGSDSMGLLLLTMSVCAPEDAVVAFVDHGLRPGIDAEWAVVRAAAERFGVAAERVAVAGVAPAGNLQEWARERRYEWLAEVALRRGCAVVATGHTLDDQAETVLLRILRGTGMTGLRGIPYMRPLDEHLALLRPLLSLRRSDIQARLRAAGLRWVSDPSNDNARFMRVGVRQRLLPLMEELVPGAAVRVAQLSQDVAQHLAACALLPQLAHAVRELRFAGGLRVRRSEWAALSPGARSQLVRELYARLHGSTRRLQRHHVQSLLQAMETSGRTRCIEFPAGVVAGVSFGDLYFFSAAPQVAVDAPVPICPAGRASLPQLGVSCIVDAAVCGDSRSLAAPWQLRTWRNGDRFAHSQKSVARRLAALRVPPFYRPMVPVLASGTQVLSCALTRGSGNGLDIRWEVAPQSPLRDLDVAAFWGHT